MDQLISIISRFNRFRIESRKNGTEFVVNIVDYTDVMDRLVSSLELLYYELGGRAVLKKPEYVNTNLDYIDWLITVHEHVVIQRGRVSRKVWTMKYKKISVTDISKCIEALINLTDFFI